MLTVRGRLLANAVTARLLDRAGVGRVPAGGRAPVAGADRVSRYDCSPCLTRTLAPDAPDDLMEKVVVAVQAARLHLPVGRDLRRLPLHLRLRTARRQHAAQRQERLVGGRWCSGATTWSVSTPPSSSPPAVWEASGHLANFTDPLVDCRNCHERWRAGQDRRACCPNCGSTDFTEARAFNLMFKTHAGPVEDEGAVAYLRPETAQGMFINFVNVLQTTRKKPPFGIAQVGKSFRNEITPQNFVFRTREFEQMEMEYFVPAGRGRALVRVLAATSGSRWYVDLGIPDATCSGCATTTPTSCRTTRRARPTSSSSSPGAGTSSRASPTAPTSTCKAHAAASGERLEYFDQATGERYVPYVIEPAAGATRTMMAFLLAAYDEDEVGRRGPHRAAPAPPAGPLPGGACCPCRRRRPSSRWPARCSGSLQPHLHVRLRRDPVDRPALPPPGRDRHAAGA